MKSLSAILEESCIDLALPRGKKKAILSRFVNLAVEAGAIRDSAAFLRELVEREGTASTAIGGGIAIPHKISSHVLREILGVGRCAEGIPFDAPDGEPVRLFFFLFAPETGMTEHLRLLSRLARFLHDQQFVSTLMTAKTPAEICAAFLGKETE